MVCCIRDNFLSVYERMLLNRFSRLSSCDNIQVKVSQKWQFCDIKELRQMNSLFEGGWFMALVHSPLHVFERPYVWYVLADR